MRDPKENPIILGVDPGSRITGYGLIQLIDKHYIALDFGCIRCPLNIKLSERYLIIFESILLLLEKFNPHVLAVESQFVYKNVQSAMKLGMARGVIMTAAKSKGMPVYQYSPTEVKRAVSGQGRASKLQVQRMVKSLLSLQENPTPEDAADALALAICHAHCSLGVFSGGAEV